MHARMLSRVQLSATIWTVAHQAPLSMGFPRQECWTGLPFPLLGDLSDPGIEPVSCHLLHWQADSLSLSHRGSTKNLMFSGSVTSDSLQPHALQYTRLPCLSPSPRVCSNSCPLSWWYHPTISSSAIPFSSCLQSFPSSESFPMSPFYTSGGWSIRP